MEIHYSQSISEILILFERGEFTKALNSLEYTSELLFENKEFHDIISYTEHIIHQSIKASIYNELGKLDLASEILSEVEIDINSTTLVDEKRQTILKCNVSVGICEVLLKKGDMVEMNARYSSIIKDLETIGDCTGEFIENIRGRVENVNGLLHLNKGENEAAARAFNRAIHYFTKSANEFYIAAVLNNLGLISHSKGELHESNRYFLESLSKFERIENKYAVALIQNNIGAIYLELGELDQALDFHKKSLAVREEIGNKQDIAFSLENIGSTLKERGNLNAALEYYNRALEIDREIGNDLNTSRTLSNMAEIYNEKGKFSLALEVFDESLKLLDSSENAYSIAYRYNSIGGVYKNIGRYDLALENYEKSYQIREKLENRLLMGVTLSEIIQCYLLIDKRDIALSKLTQLETMSVEIENNKILKLHYDLMYALYLKSGNRSLHKAEAEKILTSIVEGENISNQNTLLAMKHLVELYIVELQHYGQDEVLQEILAYIEKMQFISSKENLHPTLVETMFLMHKVTLLQGNIDKSKEILQEALEISSNTGLDMLRNKIEKEMGILSENVVLWTKINELNLSLHEKLKLQIVDNTLKQANQWLNLYRSCNGVPLLLMIIAEGGIISMSLKLNERAERLKIDEMLISSFLSAINSFGRDTFNHTGLIDVMQYEAFKIISRQLQSFLLCFIFEGEIQDINERLEALVQYIMSSDIKDRMKRFTISTQEFERHEITEISKILSS
ncbi:MAG: tetratricopeptide repeat protein [Candidatus Heimdallarchaeota archaeon]|nr:tetratricopeptide repeat protein [Candidatus Heimdallarchaeota archaeon]